MVVIWLNGGEGLGIVHGFLTKHCEKKRLIIEFAGNATTRLQ